MRDKFGGHYEVWRDRRIGAIRKYYGDSWFSGKDVLELGCGHADIGGALEKLGARVSVCDARKEHVTAVKTLFPNLDAFVCDSERDFPPGERDLVINMGLLYHLDGWERCLRETLRHSIRCVVETEVLDSLELDEIKVDEDGGYDQSFGRKGTRMSPYLVEKIVMDEGHRFVRLFDVSLNTDKHFYDWVPRGTRTWYHGQRRFWFTEKL